MRSIDDHRNDSFLGLLMDADLLFQVLFNKLISQGDTRSTNRGSRLYPRVLPDLVLFDFLLSQYAAVLDLFLLHDHHVRRVLQPSRTNNIRELRPSTRLDPQVICIG